MALNQPCSTLRDFEFDPSLVLSAGPPSTASNIHLQSSRRIKGIGIHTYLTTLKAIRLTRQLHFQYLTIFIKSMPSGDVQRFVVDGSYAVVNLYNNFCAHSHVACSTFARTLKLILPTSIGLFELSEDMRKEDEMNIAKNSGQDLLSRYKLTKKGSSIVMLCFKQYHPSSAIQILKNLLANNSKVVAQSSPSWRILNDLGNFPDNLHTDQVQLALLAMLQR